MNRTLSVTVASIGVISGLLGMVGGLISTTDQRHASMISLSLLLATVSSTLLFEVYFFAKRRRATIINSISVSSYHVCHASQAHIKEIVKLQKSHYPTDAVPEEIYLEWYEHNPDGFFVVEKVSPDSGKRELVGHITLLSFKKQRFGLYMDGDILEIEIRGKDLLPPDRRQEMSHIYIESLIVLKKHRESAIPELIKALPAMIKYFCDDAPVTQVFAMAATSDGERLLSSFNFSVVKPPRRAARKDGHQMYVSDFKIFHERLIDRRSHFESLEIRERSKQFGSIHANHPLTSNDRPPAASPLQVGRS